MADTYTPHYNLTKPEIGGDPDTWGNLLNANMDAIDTAIYNAQTVANAALPAAGGTMTGPLAFRNIAVALPGGLFRLAVDGAGIFVLYRNTAAAGDFSSSSADWYVAPSGQVNMAQRPTWAGVTPWDTGNLNPAAYAPLAGATFSGCVKVTGTAGVAPDAQGCWIAWNETNGSGAASFVNNQGVGTGGFIFRNVNQSDTVETGRVTFGANGSIIAENTIVANGGDVQATGDGVFNGAVYSGGAGGAVFQGNGNIVGSIWGGNLVDWINNNKLQIGTNAYVHTDNAHNYEIFWGLNGSGTNVLHFDVDGNEVASLVGVAVSDRRAKTRIKSAESRDSLAVIERAKFKSFDFKKKFGGSHVPIGVIAQEAPSSDWVIEGDPTGKLYMNERVMLMDALHAIKQLSARVRELEAAAH